MDKGMKKVVNLVTNYMSALCETGRVPGRVDRNIEAGTAVYFPGGGASEVIESPEDCARVLMTQQLIIYALRNRIESGAVRCYYGDWLVVRRCTKPTRTYQNYMNAFFKAFRVPVRVRYRNGFSLNGTHDLQTERIIRL